jgi:predicted O-linked N-acetylglucosamine transferase (SPINDLY family)
MASLDLDLLLDVAGLRAASGPLLARHAAREIWAVQSGDLPIAARLADRVVSGGAPAVAAGWIDALEALQRDVMHRPAARMIASELAALWDDAVQAHQRGDTVAAKAGYAKVLDAQPLFASALYLSGLVARADNDSATARECLRSAIRSAPDFVDARVALADLALASGDPEEASTVAKQGLERQTDSANLWRALGQACLHQGDAARATMAFSEALKRDPTHGETHYNHGVALQMAREPAEAARAYQRALAFRADLYAADFNLGVIFDQQGNAGAAISAFTNVLERVPDYAPAFKALAETLLASGRIEAWFANFERFELHCPNHLALAAHALEVCAYRADFAKLEQYLDGLRSGRFSEGEPHEVLDALEQILYLLHFFDVEAALIGSHARTHDALARRLYGEARPRRSMRKPGKVRVGYLSGDFRNHVMGKMMWEALRHHDRDRFDIFGYTTADARDEWTDRYEGLFGRLQAVNGLTDRQAATRVEDDDLDLLVDLSTHTKGSRPGILALKPARVQVTHVATAGSLAMSAIDYKLTDRYADLAYDPELQIEQPLVMDGCVYPYRHVAPASPGIFTRERAGIPSDAIVIGAFFTPLKLSQRCLGLWRDVMERVPNAVIAFSPVHPSLRSVFQRICAAGGIDGLRVAFLPQGRDDAENQARYALIDFVLDPMPYGGVNGTLEALAMCVPVVTLVGHRHAERTSYSILMNLGITDTIAHTGRDYVDIAVRLATDRAFMRALRGRIGDALAHSALTDMPAHARSLERAYMTALEARAPEALDDVRHHARSIG